MRPPSILFIIAFSMVSSCKQKDTNTPSQKCVELNNKGVSYMMNNTPNDRQSDLNKAIKLYKQAIACDTAYVTAYINLATAYDDAHLYSERMHVLNKLIVLTKGHPSFLLLKATLLEKTDHLDSASKWYQLTRKAYGKHLAKKPDDISLITGKIDLIAVMEGKNQAIKELDREIKLNPDLRTKLAYEYSMLDSFDRHSFVYGETVTIIHNK